MNTRTRIPDVRVEPADDAATGDQQVLWQRVGWDGFEAILQIQGDRSRPQILYLDGNVTLMSPSRVHERRNDRLGTLVREVFNALGIPCIPTRETLFRRGRDEAGVQPDDSFYFANLGPIAAKADDADIDLQTDPPPDLVIEVVHKNKADDAVEILRRLGVPEVWVSLHDRLQILVRGEDGRHVEAQRSLVYPFLSAAELHDWATRRDLPVMTEWTRALRRWIAEVVVPRIQAG